MGKIFAITLAPWLLGLLCASPIAVAQGLTCDDIEFDASAVAEFPSVARTCHSVVERDGKLYVRLVAKVVRVRADGSLTLDLKTRDGSSVRQDFKPPRGFHAMISGKPTLPQDLVRGQEIRLYLPSDRWRVVSGSPDGGTGASAPRETVRP